MEQVFMLKYLIFISGMIVFSWLVNHIFLKFVKSLGIRNLNETVIRWSESSKPSIGGLSFYIIFLLSISSFSFVFAASENIFGLREIGVLMACTLGFLMGLSDDAYDTRPILKSLTQIACALILIFTGSYIQLFENNLTNALLTIIWVMGIMNSVNMLDNMDGITGSVSLIILLTIIGCFFITGFTNNFYFILVSGISCALIGFLYFNWHPSKMFMGDSGSQFLGIFLATMGIIFFWNLEPLGTEELSFSKKFIIPCLAFIVPIVDTTTVVINRLSKGQSPFVGGKDHTTHNLARLGLKDPQVAVAVAVISLLSSIIILYCYDIEWSYGRTISLLVYLLVIFIALYMVTQINRKKGRH
jgi:UDP-GlcNAc:undecaprenyl-phosphate GlcNAc-1-phosphate transferase